MRIDTQNGVRLQGIPGSSSIVACIECSSMQEPDQLSCIESIVTISNVSQGPGVPAQARDAFRRHDFAPSLAHIGWPCTKSKSSRAACSPETSYIHSIPALWPAKHHVACMNAEHESQD